MRRHFSLAVVAALVSGGAARAQIRDAGARVERLAENVYVIVHDDALRTWPAGGTDWPHGNTGVVIGDAGVLVVDATFLPSRARADIALIRRLTRLPVRYLVNTHWHGDHTHGNSVYRDSFPQVAIVSSRPNRDLIAVNQARFKTRVAAPAHASRGLIVQHEALLARGADSTGRAITAEERRDLERHIAERKHEVDDLPTLRVEPPDSVFDERLVLTLGRRRVELRDHGHGNSPYDVTIWLPAERILFTGDLVVHPVPYAFASYPTLWVPVLRELERQAPAALVPGHGPVMRSLDYVVQVRTLLETVLERVKPFLLGGQTADEARRSVRLDDLRRRFNPADAPALDEMWNASIVNALIPRSFSCLQGVTC